MIAALMVVALPVLLQGPAAPPRATLDSIFQAVRSGRAGPALAMAVVDHGRLVYRNVAGYADLELRVPATLDTRFDWASIAKQFTAFAVAQLAEQHRLSPSDPAIRYLPELDLGGARVTLDQLLHHTAGLEDTDGLYALAGGRMRDAVEFDEMLGLLLRQQHVRFAPGERHEYANGGYTLLAEIVQRVTGTPFVAWTDSAIFRPLGMTHSGFLSSPMQLVPGRALPYERDPGDGGFRRSSVDAPPGPGGLYSTVGDMALWMRNLMHPWYQAAATLRLRERGRLASGEELDYAWGVGSNQYRGQATLLHGGSGPATEAQLLTFPDLEFGVVVVAAGPTGQNPSTLAYLAADLFLADRLAARDSAPKRRMIMMTEEMLNQRPEESIGVRVPAERLLQLAGSYRIEDDPVLVVRPAGDHLEMAWGGRLPYLPLFPLPDGRFVMVPLWTAYRFTQDSSGTVTGVVREKTPRSLGQGGPDRTVGVRLPDPPTFDSTSAAPYLGWYYSDELATFYQVALNRGRLELRHARHGALELTPLGPDEFGISSRLIAAARFGRAGGRVIGLELEAFSWSARTSFRKLPSGP